MHPAIHSVIADLGLRDMERTIKLAAVSILVGAAVFGLKLVAYFVTGSVALYSDALESVINVVTAIGAFLAIRLSAKPADREHPYGHHKAEYLSAVLEGVLISLAAVSILREAYLGFLDPKPLNAPVLGLFINGFASAVNAAWSYTLIRYGRQHRSPALVADGRHLLTDVVTSAGVFVGVALTVATGWTVLDPAIAVLVALNVVWMGAGLMKESVGGLMDAAPPPDVQDKIRSLIATEAGGALEAHDLRTRNAGRMTFIDFHLVVPGDMTVREAHDICDRVEQALKHAMGETVITIHVEPEHKAKHSGIVVV